MVNVTVPIEKREYEVFKKFVGIGNVSKTLREYMESYSKSKDKDEIIIRKKLDIAFREKEKIDSEFFELKAQLDAIESKRRLEELKLEEQEQEQNRIVTRVGMETMKKELHRIV